MDYLVIIIMLVVIIVIGIILSRPFINAEAAPGTPPDQITPSDQHADALNKVEDSESTNANATLPEGDNTAK